MDLSARWDKILHDIWNNKSRSLLVICTLAIGIAVVGLINNTVQIVTRDLFKQFQDRNPASVIIYASPFRKELAQSVAGMREIEFAEAQRSTYASISAEKDQWITLEMITVPDFDENNVYRLPVEQGVASPGLRGILIERNSAAALGLAVGDPVTVEMQDGIRYQLTVAGIVHDMSDPPYSITNEVRGYVSMSTLEWMGEAPYYTQLKIVVAENKQDQSHVMAVAAMARDRVIEPAGYQVAAMQIPGTNSGPGEFWAKNQVNGVLLVLQIMSILGILLSGGLVVNTISAVLVQQVKQIGIMRSVGASRTQIVQIYLAYVLVLSVVGLVLSIPLGMLGAWGLSSVGAAFLNFNVTVVDLPPSVLILQAVLGLVMPVGVALGPILNGTRMSVYDAIYQYGLGGDGERGWIEGQLVRVKRLSPPISLSLRNTFRNKSRLGFTLVTLTIAGAMFMAVFSSYTTLNHEIRGFGRYIAFDASIDIPGGANKYTAEREALRLPGIQVAEGWASLNGFIVHADGSESDRIEVVGLPANAQTIEPLIVKGRWLQLEDTEQVVLNEDLVIREPDISVGSEIVIKINGIKRSFQVVGVVSKHMIGSRVYMNYDQFAKLTGRHNQVDEVRVLATPGAFSTTAQQELIGKELEERFNDAQLSTSSSKTRNEIFGSLSQAFNILVIILLLMAGILAVIGGLGLTGTMGMNVLERTREIGVLRAVGASHHSVRQVVVIEGVAVALLSWTFSALLSYPVGSALAIAVIGVAFSTVPTFSYSFLGLLAWLGVVILIGVVSSLVPAREAARLTVREVLNYE